jgi:hypothetical protein
MKKVRYKVGKVIASYNNYNDNYRQTYWCDKLYYKGYRNKYGKFIGYQEDYIHLMNKGIRYVL